MLTLDIFSEYFVAASDLVKNPCTPIDAILEVWICKGFDQQVIQKPRN
jgi:hypothetical protein